MLALACYKAFFFKLKFIKADLPVILKNILEYILEKLQFTATEVFFNKSVTFIITVALDWKKW